METLDKLTQGNIAIGLLRNNKDGIFGYYNKSGHRGYSSYYNRVFFYDDSIGGIAVKHTSRAVIINGEGI